MDILILQEAGRHTANENYREALCLQRAIYKIDPKACVYVTGLNYASYQPLISEMRNYNRTAIDMVIVLENYDETNWLPYDVITKLKRNDGTPALKVFWSIDSHMNLNQHCQIADKMKADMVLCAIESDMPFFVADGRKIVYFPNCYDDSLIFPMPVHGEKNNIGFCGSVIEDRPHYLTKLYEQFKIKLDIMKLGDDMVRAINSYKIHFNKSIADDINYRVFETLGCQTCLITNEVENLEKLFKPSTHLYTYKNATELIDLVYWLMENPSKREASALAGYKHVKKFHTYEARAMALLDIYKNFNRYDGFKINLG